MNIESVLKVSVAHNLLPAAKDSDETNKSELPSGEEYGEQKGIPANRPGSEEDMAQVALMLACNQYAYGQVSTTFLAYYKIGFKVNLFLDGGR